jgi:hypothetical protein
MVSELLNYLAANDVYIGWSIWAAGPSKSVFLNAMTYTMR